MVRMCLVFGELDNSNPDLNLHSGWYDWYAPQLQNHLYDTFRAWRPEDILSMKPRNILPSRKTVMMNAKLSDSLNMDSSEFEDDFDFEDEDKEAKKLNVNHKKTKTKNGKPCYEKKLANARGEDDKKYMRLDEYFKNAKEVQEKFDDIDFSDEDDYSNMEDDGLNRRKREVKSENENAHPMGCSCSHMVGDLLKTFQTALESQNEGDYKSLELRLDTYDNLIKSMKKDKENKVKSNSPKKRSVDGMHHNYRPICDTFRRWRPEDILSMKPRNILPSRKTVMINDLPLYQHLLHTHRNNVKRSIGHKKSKLLLEDSDESLDSILNRIDKDDASEADDEERDFQLVFPNKNKFELKKKKNVTEVIFEHQTSEKTTTSPTGEKEESHGKKRFFHKDLSNIQVIPKNGTETFFHHAFDHLHSFIHKVGSKIRGYLDEFFN